MEEKERRVRRNVNANNRECEIRDLAKSCGRKYAGPRFIRDLTYTTYIFATSPPSLHVAAPRFLSRNLWRSTMNYSRSRARLSAENFIIELFHFYRFLSLRLIHRDNFVQSKSMYTRNETEMWEQFQILFSFFSPRKKMFPLKRCFFFLRKVLFDSLHNTITWFDVYIYRKIILMDRCEKFY